MKRSSSIEAVNIVNIDYVDDGRSIRFEMIDAGIPHDIFLVIFKNYYICNFCRSVIGEYPLIAIDLTSHELEDSDKELACVKLGFQYHDQQDRIMVPDTTMYITHFEGDFVGDILSEGVSITKVGRAEPECR